MILTKLPIAERPHLWVLGEKNEPHYCTSISPVKLKIQWKMNINITVTFYVPLKFSEDII